MTKAGSRCCELTFEEKTSTEAQEVNARLAAQAISVDATVAAVNSSK